jgi:hypothetical protein
MNKKVKSKIFHYNFFPKNCKGTDKIISVYWFFVLFIVASAVVYMVVIFYGDPYDVREIESNLLLNAVADCVSEAGEINDLIIGDEGVLLDKSNFFEKCNINFDVEDYSGWTSSSEYFVEVNFLDFVSGNPIKQISLGNLGLSEYCEGVYGDSKNNPVCVEKEFYSLDKQGKSYTIKIMSGVRKTEKNVK